MKRVLLALVLAACGGSKSSTKPVEPGPAPSEPTEQGAAAAEPAVPTPPAPTEPAAPPAPKSAKVTLAAASKSKVSGTASFVEKEDGVEITVTAEGLTPGDHAWHVHEKVHCSAP